MRLLTYGLFSINCSFNTINVENDLLIVTDLWLFETDLGATHGLVDVADTNKTVYRKVQEVPETEAAANP